MALVLIADDQPPVRAACRRILEGAGHDVAEAADGLRAVDLYRAAPRGVVLCDLDMPVMDGLGLIRRLKAEFSDVRIVATSGSDELRLAVALGAVRAVAKPFRAADLVAAVTAALEPGA